MPDRPLPPGELLEALAEARTRGHWLQAIQLFTDTLESVLNSHEKQGASASPDLLRCQMGPNFAELLLPSLHRSSNQCPLIEAYRAGGRGPMELVTRLLGPIDQVFIDGQVSAAEESLLDRLQMAGGQAECEPQDRMLRGLELRLATIQFLDAYSINPRNCKDRIKGLLEAYQTFWQTHVWRHAKPSGRQTPSAAWFHLHDCNTALATEFSAVINERGCTFHDPAAAFLIDTLCELLNAPIPNRTFCTELEDGGRWHSGDTYALVVRENILGIAIRGIVLRLRIERVGCNSSEAMVSGCFYPHPHSAAYMQISDDFQEAIRNAWIAVVGSSVSLYDYRWSLIPVDNLLGHSDWFHGPIHFYDCHADDWDHGIPHTLRHQFLYVSLSGPSATLPFALALKSVQLREGCLLRKDLVASAAFELPMNKAGQRDCKELAAQAAILKPVGQIPEKANIPELEQLKISKLLVANNQVISQPVENWSAVSSFDAVWKRFSIHEARIAEFAKLISQKWNEEIDSLAKADFEGRQNDTDRLDRFVMPELSWEIVHKFPSAGEERYKLEKVEGDKLQQFQSIWKHLEIERAKSPKYLFLYDTAGAGKSVVSIRLREQLCKSDLVQLFFTDGLPRFVFRWIKALPTVTTSRIIEMLCHDPEWPSTVDAKERNETIRYALDQERVVIIVDGLDEFSIDDQLTIMRMLHPRAANRDQDASKCQWVFTGRQHVIDEWFQNSDVFSDLNSLRLRIQPFSEEKQNDYFADLKAKGLDWRNTLTEIVDKDRQELLGLPMNLRAIRRLIEETIEQSKPIPSFVSHSDLFLQTARPMLDIAMRKRTDAQKEEDRKTGLKPAAILELLENVLGLVAFQMAIDGQWRSIKPEGSKSLSQTIEAILEKAKTRARGKAEKHWDWAIDVLKTIVFNNRATTEAFGGDYLAFQNRRVQEMHVARYLTVNATDEDLRGTFDLNSTLGYIGDRGWENIWKATIKMPSSKIDIQRYREVIKLLFERPKHSKQRRSTELMWDADQWIKAQAKLKGSGLLGLDQELRKFLGEQFRGCLDSKNSKEQEVAQSLIDPASYKILADPTNPEYSEEEIKKHVPDFESGKFRMGDEGVDVTLSKFGMGKVLVTNEQFQLFDNNFAEYQKYSKRFGRDNQPCVFVSWFDGYWFSEFVGFGAEVEIGSFKWRTVIPTEAQFEYAYRAGCRGKYFYARQAGRIIEVNNDSLQLFAHFDQDWGSGTTVDVDDKEPNAWGLRLAGNVWKWVYDCYKDSLDGGHDPVNTKRSSSRVLRGGCWSNSAAYCGSSFRDGLDPSYRWNGDGLVLALSPLESPRLAQENE